LYSSIAGEEEEERVFVDDGDSDCVSTMADAAVEVLVAILAKRFAGEAGDWLGEFPVAFFAQVDDKVDESSTLIDDVAGKTVLGFLADGDDAADAKRSALENEGDVVDVVAEVVDNRFIYLSCHAQLPEKGSLKNTGLKNIISPLERQHLLLAQRRMNSRW